MVGFRLFSGILCDLRCSAFLAKSWRFSRRSERPFVFFSCSWQVLNTTIPMLALRCFSSFVRSLPRSRYPVKNYTVRYFGVKGAVISIESGFLHLTQPIAVMIFEGEPLSRAPGSFRCPANLADPFNNQLFLFTTFLIVTPPGSNMNQDGILHR